LANSLFKDLKTLVDEILELLLVHEDTKCLDPFNQDERTTYTDAAIILAADALSRTSPASGLFIDHDALPPLVEIDSDDSINNRAD
jgi:hypothetical protein